jgi:peptide methionine sulfoxide reductase MsrB
MEGPVMSRDEAQALLVDYTYKTLRVTMVFRHEDSHLVHVVSDRGFCFQDLRFIADRLGSEALDLSNTDEFLPSTVVVSVGGEK